jgi:subtilisin family serine protease
MSLGGSGSASLDTAVRNSIASGVTYAVAAGNEKKDACGVSPARTAEAITVGATDSTDARASYSNFGTCVDIFAPGSNILSSVKSGDTAAGKMSGTSMATPHVAGVAALYLANNPALTPAQLRDKMVADSTAGKVTSPGTGSPNKLLYTGAIPTGTTTTPPPTTTPTTPTTPTTVPAGTPCTVTNTADVTMADKATVESKLTVANCTGKGSTKAKVEVHVKHSDRGDLAVWLIAPDGTLYKLKSSTSGDNVANLDATYTVNLSAETRNGVWKLRVRDVFAGDTGFVNSWTLTV